MHLPDLAMSARSLLSGAIVGYVLGLVGGGGSILAVPLLVYFVGYRDHPHVAIGTTALAVAVNAIIASVPHFRRRHVDLRSGAWFAAAGVLGATAGSRLGLLVDGKRLLLMFAALMVLVAVLMWRRTLVPQTGGPDAGAYGPPRQRGAVPAAAVARLAATGLVVGAASGFFGIGGGFLIVPGLLAATAMPMLTAVGTSLLSVAAFGATTAVQYGMAGAVDLPIAVVFILGGLGGGLAGALSGTRLGGRALTRVFSVVVVAVALYMAGNVLHFV
jgi:uncharacterized membrane protein YfcA